MSIISIIVAFHFIAFVAYLLYNRYNPQAVLILMGILMFFMAKPLGNSLAIDATSGIVGIDLFTFIKDAFSRNLVGAGLMIMTIGGFVSYLHKIGANNALVYVSIQPLSIFRKSPYFAATMVIPIGQLLFISIPSATGLVLLLVVSILPILVGLGISRLSAVSVITACTVFDMGPGSSNTTKASELIGKPSISYFLDNQLPLVIPLTIVMMVLFFFLNRYHDKKSGHIPVPIHQDEIKVDVPLIYAILPLFPLILLLLFSPIFNLFATTINIDITTAILITLFVALLFEFIRTRKLKETLDSLTSFWEGMGKLFISVVTLIVAAEIFAKGLISIGFISGLIETAQNLGFGAIGFGIAITIIVFMTSILTGSGSAIFQSFAPNVYNILTHFGFDTIATILPMQMASSLGRAISPISGVVIASSQIAEVSPYALAKRNTIPLVSLLVLMIILAFIP